MNKTPRSLWDLLEQARHSPETFEDEVMVSTDELKISVHTEN